MKRRVKIKRPNIEHAPYHFNIELEYLWWLHGEVIVPKPMPQSLQGKLNVKRALVYVNRTKASKHKHYKKIERYYDRAHGLEGVLV